MIGILLGSWQTHSRSAGKSDLITRFCHIAVNNPAYMLAGALDGMGDFLYGASHSGSLTEENRRLRVIANAEALYNSRLDELQAEIDRLQKLEQIPAAPGKRRIPARVIGIFPDEFRVSLSAGSAQGVIPGNPVVAPEGLLGVVSTVEPGSCQATLVWAPLPFKIGGVVVRNPSPAGLLHGESWDRLSLDLEIGAPAQAGDLVVTSGFSDRIPRGIPIGRIAHVQEDQDFGVEHVEILPSAQLGNVQEVVILR